MVTITQLEPSRAAPALGQEGRFAASGDALAAIDYFLEHEGVLYPQPLRTESDGSVRVYPEAPGRYGLHAAWRSERGEHGWARIEFQVKGTAGLAPQRVKADGERLWVPTAWDAQALGSHERPVFHELQRIVRTGATVYDIGANVGLYSVRFARWIGAGGWLYAIEPNPVCVYFLRSNLEQVGPRNFTIVPIAVSDRRADSSFSINYGSSLIGIGGDSPVAAKPGHRVRVEADCLDRLIAVFGFRKPDFIKLDVEGAEASAVGGMINTLERHRPGLMIELHGREAAAGALGSLARLGYQYVLCSTGARYATAEALLAAVPDACVQVIGHP